MLGVNVQGVRGVFCIRKLEIRKYYGIGGFGGGGSKKFTGVGRVRACRGWRVGGLR